MVSVYGCVRDALDLSQDSERFLSRSQDMEHQLSSKERELDHLFQKQKRVRGVPPYTITACHLHSLNMMHHMCYIPSKQVIKVVMTMDISASCWIRASSSVSPTDPVT